MDGNAGLKPLDFDKLNPRLRTWKSFGLAATRESDLSDFHVLRQDFSPTKQDRHITPAGAIDASPLDTQPESNHSETHRRPPAQFPSHPPCG